MHMCVHIFSKQTTNRVTFKRLVTPVRMWSNTDLVELAAGNEHNHAMSVFSCTSTGAFREHPQYVFTNHEKFNENFS